LIPGADAEIAVGMDCYATTNPPCPARAKSMAEDFVVEEQIAVGGLVSEDRADYYPIYRVEKRSIDTMHMAEELSDALRSRVSYGGLKDKKSLAVQYATPTSLRSSRPPIVVGQRFTAHLMGYVPRPLSRAAVIGNRFEVVLRDCCPEIERLIEDVVRIARDRRLPNFYGLQRFGVSGAGTHRVGRALVRREFEEAVRLILFEGHQSDDASLSAIEAMSAGKYEEGARLLPTGRDVERLVAQALSRHPGDWVRALRAVPVRLRRLYVQAYQSMIFNRTLSRALAKGEDISRLQVGDNWAGVSEGELVTSRVGGVHDQPTMGAVPMVQLVGYAYRDYGSRFDACVRETIEVEGVLPRQFYIQEMQEVSAEGGFRRPHLALKDASWKVEGRTATLWLTLGKGQYATVLLREVVKASDPASAGLA
jgi:tRNA pseudouridine13 synthase